MRALRVVLFLFIFHQAATAQVYPFPQPGAEWGEYMRDLSTMLHSNKYRKYVGDTVMCGYTYAMYCTAGTGCGPGQHDYNYTRYDSGKVYWREYGCTYPEKLLYDFAANAGDTVITYLYTRVVDSVYYAPLLNGQMRKHMRFQNGPGNYVYWIDGIGDTKGGFFYGSELDIQFITACHKDSSGLLLYNSDPYYDCDSMDIIPISATGAVQNASCWCCCDGSISATASGGVGPYFFLWPSTIPILVGSTINGLCPGQYWADVSDSNGVYGTAQFTVYGPPAPPVPVIVQSNDTLYCSAPGVTYQWYFNNSMISNATSQYYVPVQSGNYRVAITYPDGCTDYSSQYNMVTTGLNALMKAASIKVNPVVNDGSFVLEFPLLTSTAHLIIVNTFGKTMYFEMLPMGTHQMQLRLPNLAPGVYFIRVDGLGTVKMVRK